MLARPSHTVLTRAVLQNMFTLSSASKTLRQAMLHVRTLLPSFAVAVVAISIPASTHAAVTKFDAFGYMQYTQSANNTAPAGSPADYFIARLFYAAGDVTAANATSGNQPAFNYTPEPGNFALFQTVFIPPSTLAGYQAPGTSITAQVTAGNFAGTTGSHTFGPTLYSAQVPYLTGNSYNQLQGLNAAQSETLTFNGFSAVAGSNESDEFLTLSKTDGTVVFSAGFLSNTTTSKVIPANTLAAGTTYTLDIDYSSRVNSTITAFGGSSFFTASYDTRTQIGFTTAVPEPASLAFVSAALALLLRRSGKRKF